MKRGAGAVLAASLLLGGCMSILDSLIFFPDREVPDPPAGVEERWITASDGLRIHAWWIGGTGRPALVWSHGNGGNIAGRVGVSRALAGRGLAVLAYDYRGYGRSEGSPSEHGAYLDAEAAYDHLLGRGLRAEDVVCFGESLGAAVSVELARRRPCAALVLVSPFTRLRDVARHHYGPFGRLAGERFDSLSRLAAIARPVFIAHGDRDEIVPFALGESLFAAAREPKRFFRAGGYHHNDVFECEALLDEIAGFAHGLAR